MLSKYDQILVQQKQAFLEDWIKANPFETEVENEESRKNLWDAHLERGRALTAEAAGERAEFLFLRWKCQTDLFFLASKILGLDKAVNMLGRKRLDPKLHGELCENLEREEDTLMLYPRNHMKSTFAKMRMVQLILRNPDVRIGLWSKTTALAKKELKSIKGYFKKKLLKQLFPEFAGKFQVDTAEALTVWRDPESSVQESQIEVWGITSTVTGHHYDYHFYDDIIDQDSVKNATQIQQVRDWWEYMQAIRDLGAIEKIIGTRYHLRDIYGTILGEGLFDKENVVIRSAIEKGRPIYSFYTLKDLGKLKKKMGEDKFSSQMQNEPVASADKIFHAPYPMYDVLKAPRRRKYYMAIDPAATTQAYSDETGISIGFMDKHEPNALFVEEAFGVKMSPDKLADKIVEKLIRYRPHTVGIELGLQQALMPLIGVKISEWEKLHKGEFISPKWVEIKTGNTAKAVKLDRILGAMLRDERVRFPGIYHGDIFRAAKQMDKVFAQLDTYNPNSDYNEDDVIDSLNMLIQTVEHFSAGHWFGVNRENTVPGFTQEYIMKNFMGQQEPEGWDRMFA